MTTTTSDSAPGHWIGPSVLLALPPRAPDSHKGDFGTVGILGGATGMTGALMLCARAALHLGAGKVYAASLSGQIMLDLLHPEIMWLNPDTLLKLSTVSILAVGPGLGLTQQAEEWLAVALQSTAILVLDADALNLLSLSHYLKQLLVSRNSPSLLTPHPGEAANLLGCDIPALQSDRPAAGLRLAKEYRSYVVLKGAGSLCVAPDGNWLVNTTGNPGLSSAGMGDVLTGILAAFLAQQLDPFMALQLAVYLHGAAADSLLIQGIGPVGLTASEVVIEARRLLNRSALLPDSVPL